MPDEAPKPRARSFSNREALRKLTRGKFPAVPELAVLAMELAHGPDTEAAIIASALTETALEQLIESRFENKDPNLVGRVFLNRGPLSDLDSKILTAHAFGIISSETAELLHSIKAIRNVFAHSNKKISFENEIIKREITSLRLFQPFHDLDLTIDARSPKILFLFASMIAITVLEQNRTGVARQPDLAMLQEAALFLYSWRQKSE